jgi:hypothetical protein
LKNEGLVLFSPELASFLQQNVPLTNALSEPVKASISDRSSRSNSFRTVSFDNKFSINIYLLFFENDRADAFVVHVVKLCHVENGF